MVEKFNDMGIHWLYIKSAAVAATFYSNGTNFTYTGSIVVLISIMIFIAAHGFGQGAVIWVFISEIFPNKVRAGAVTW